MPETHLQAQSDRELTFAQAIREALAEEMRRDPTVFILGEDVAEAGTPFKVLSGLLEEFGKERVLDTPISEAGFTGLAVGAAMTGMRPVVDIMFGDFVTLTMDQMVNQAAKVHYMSGGRWKVPMVMRTTMGATRRSAAQHSQSLHAWFCHIPGLKVVLPSTPYDAKGLLISAIEDDDPVIFLEPKRIYNGPFDGHHDRPVSPWAKHPASEVPEGHYTIPLGRAAIAREGNELTVLAYGTMVHVALAAAADAGVDAEVIDLRTMQPLDLDAIVKSVEKTGRCVIVHEATRTSGYGAELSALVQENCFYHLEAPIERVAGWDTPYPHAFEWQYFPGPGRVADAMRRAMGK